MVDTDFLINRITTATLLRLLELRPELREDIIVELKRRKIQVVES